MGRGLFGKIYDAIPNYEWVSSNEISEYLKAKGINLSPPRVAQIISHQGSSLVEKKNVSGNRVMFRKKQTQIVY